MSARPAPVLPRGYDTSRTYFRAEVVKFTKIVADAKIAKQ